MLTLLCGGAASCAAAPSPNAVTPMRASKIVLRPGRHDRPAIAGMAQPKLSFDYTHLGRTGADYFSALVTVELALAVPDMRPLLIP